MHASAAQAAFSAAVAALFAALSARDVSVGAAVAMVVAKVVVMGPLRPRKSGKVVMAKRGMLLKWWANKQEQVD